MKTYIVKEIYKIINYIENNLKEEITSQDILKQTWYSDYHLLRTFQKCTGYTLMDYLRKRRLSAAAYELCKKDKRVIDVSYDYFFGYEQTFIRAFKKEFSLTPGTFRKHKINIKLYQKLSLQQLLDKVTDKQHSADKLLLNHGVILIGIKRKVNYMENSVYSVCKHITNDFIKNWKYKIKKYDSTFMYAYDEKIIGDPEHFYTMPCVAVPPDCPVPPGMARVKLNLHVATDNMCYFLKYIDDLINNDYECIYKNIYEQYLPVSSYQSTNNFDYSITDLQKLTDNSTSFSIHVPIIEKNIKKEQK